MQRFMKFSLYLLLAAALVSCSSSGSSGGSDNSTTTIDTAQESESQSTTDTGSSNTGSVSDNAGTSGDQDANQNVNTDSKDNSVTPPGITNYIFTKTDPSCSAYIGEFTSTIQDLGNDRTLTGSLSITTDGSTCTISSNSIPNHDVNDKGAFANTIGEVNETFSIPVSPSVASSTTQLSLEYDNAIFLNGAKLDLLAAACYGVGPNPLGKEKIGCMQTDTPWRYDPMSPLNKFGTDSHNAHTQPDGAYHYHGDPMAIYDSSGQTASGVIGFAADGFPIYGPFIDKSGSIRRVTSSYVLKNGMRQNQSGEGAFPGGTYDGTYIDDYEYQAGVGDLDECNGMMINGRYGYFVTSTYPWIMKCFKGTPDSSFRK